MKNYKPILPALLFMMLCFFYVTHVQAATFKIQNNTDETFNYNLFILVDGELGNIAGGEIRAGCKSVTPQYDDDVYYLTVSNRGASYNGVIWANKMSLKIITITDNGLVESGGVSL